MGALNQGCAGIVEPGGGARDGASKVLGIVEAGYDAIFGPSPQARSRQSLEPSGNARDQKSLSFEVCLDEADNVWFMLHSGFAAGRQPNGRLLHRAGKKRYEEVLHQSADVDLAYFPEHTEHFDIMLRRSSGRRSTHGGIAN